MVGGILLGLMFCFVGAMIGGAEPANRWVRKAATAGFYFFFGLGLIVFVLACFVGALNQIIPEAAGEELLQATATLAELEAEITATTAVVDRVTAFMDKEANTMKGLDRSVAGTEASMLRVYATLLKVRLSGLPVQCRNGRDRAEAIAGLRKVRAALETAITEDKEIPTKK